MADQESSRSRSVPSTSRSSERDADQSTTAPIKAIAEQGVAERQIYAGQHGSIVGGPVVDDEHVQSSEIADSSTPAHGPTMYTEESSNHAEYLDIGGVTRARAGSLIPAL